MGGRFSSKVIFVVLIFLSCVDRIDFDIIEPQAIPLTVFGSITSEPGPYTVRIATSFDIESDNFTRLNYPAKEIRIADDQGIEEKLREVERGIYQTTSIVGKIGRSYKIIVEFLDGRVYESLPDTIKEPGTINGIHTDFKSGVSSVGIPTAQYEISVDGIANSNDDFRYLWKFIGTFKAETHPEIYNPDQPQGCNPDPDVFNTCNFVALCSGYKRSTPLNIKPPQFKKYSECTCCTCWYDIFNSSPVLSQDRFDSKGIYNDIKVYSLPVTAWYFMHDVHVAVQQQTLTQSTYKYFRSIQAQREAVNSLFQPITGRMPNTFLQISGKPAPLNGIFYAAGSTSITTWIQSEDIPDWLPLKRIGGNVSCLEFFPNATTSKPDYWQE